MAVVLINDKPVDIGNERLNLVQAAAKAGVFIPHYCWHPALSVVASCRMCLVEVGDKKPDGTVAMQPRVVPACQTPAKDGTVCITNSEKAKFSQARTLEGLLLNHPLDCPVCDKAGECMLQDYSYRFGKAQSRMIDPKNRPANKPDIGEHLSLFTDRCIMCSRCVRFTREISGSAELQVINRGHHSEIDIFPGDPVNNPLAGNVVDLCPVGALANKEFLYKQRVWFLKSQKSVCAGCSTGCSIHIDHNKDIVYRIRPRENPQAQGYFICDEGRFDFPYINGKERFDRPLVKPAGERSEPAESAVAWETALPDIRDVLKKSASALAAVVSPMLTVEEAYLFAKLIKGFSPQATLYLGWVPNVGKDESFPRDRKGNPVGPVQFTIRAEKCPNRRGVEEVLKHFQGEVLGFDRLIADISSPLPTGGEGAGVRRRPQALYLTAGYPPRLGAWLNDEQTKTLSTIPLLIVQDLAPTPITQTARYVLPAATFAEKDGCFVNHANLAQQIRWAVRPGTMGRTDGQIFLSLLGRRGLIQATKIRQELAAEIPFFAPLAVGDLGEFGVKLG
ncbi:MAG: 2Fe-2S iron-sulfur cluster binding domain-containing protein [Planctomycetes bacterium]|nr:2Fe-2S iron-sulfur cluster binding domain-containing protein [Planctomycetota bacterium]